MSRELTSWSLAVVGCGAAGLGGARALMAGPVLRKPDRVLLVDRDKVERHNGLTCPEYASQVGRLKVDVLAALIRTWCRESVPPTGTYPGDVEGFDWRAWLAPDAAKTPSALSLVLMALDDYQSRLCVVEDLRHQRGVTPGTIVIAEVGLDRDQAMVSVIGDRWENCCPACGLASLPGPDPCVAIAEDGRPVRGDLQREVFAAASLVRRIAADCLCGRADHWRNTKTNLLAVHPGSATFRAESRTRQPVPGCLGPHGPATPIHWSQDTVSPEKEAKG